MKRRLLSSALLLLALFSVLVVFVFDESGQRTPPTGEITTEMVQEVIEDMESRNK